MSTLALTIDDTTTLCRRNLRRLQRYPSLTVMLIGMPVVFLLLFVYVFGGQLGTGLTAAVSNGTAGRSAYLDYVVPGILAMTVAASVQGTAIVVAMDMTSGIIDRFRTMAIARPSVLAGHALTAMVQLLGSVMVVLAFAVALGFRPQANVVEWLAAVGLVVLFGAALVWLTMALGLHAKTVEAASNSPMILLLLPFLSSGFVPTDTMPAGLRAFAEYQPFTPVIETLRGLLTGTPIDNHALLAILWSIVIGVPSYLWAIRLYTRREPA